MEHWHANVMWMRCRPAGWIFAGVEPEPGQSRANKFPGLLGCCSVPGTANDVECWRDPA
jgi:hypothetical protein